MRYKYPLLTRRILRSIGLLLIAAFFNVNEVRASLGVGDIAVIGWNSDPAVSTKDFAVVVLATIASGETIYITDKGITLGAFQSALTTEGIFSWTTSSTIAAGTVIKFSVTSGASPGVTSSPSVGTLTVTEGWSSTSTASPFGNNGDQIIIFQGSTASPTFIYGFNAGINTTGLSSGWNTGGGTANNYSEIPPGLTNGTNAVGFGGASALDNYSYTGTITGTKASLLAAISNSANWSTDDTNAYSLAPGGTQFPGTNPIFTLTSSNSAPTDISLSASSINENVSANSTVGTLSSTDPDVGNTFTYSLVAGTGSTDNASFSISGSSLLIAISPDYETKSSYSIRIRTTDQGTLTYEEQFTITINDLAEGVLLSTSPTLTFTSNPAAITSDDIASDGEGGSQAISDIDIQVYNISNTSGTLLAALSWQNNSFMGSASGSYSGLTNENNAGSKGMAIKSASGSEFRINQFLYYNWGETSSFTNTVKGYRDGSEVASTTFDGFDSGYNPKTITLTSAFQNVDEVRFYISAGGYMGDQSATNHSINSIALASPVVSSNSAPTDIALSSTAVNENVSANTTVGTLSSTDPDVGNTFTYTLVAGTGSTDNASFNISGSSLRITASPDFETKSSYSVRVRTTDQGSLTFEKQFTITINDVNEAPTDVALSATAVNENVSANTTVGTLSSTDADAGNTFTYTLVAGTGSTDNASFNISGSSLRITASPDFETKSSYSVRVRTTDQGSLTFEKQFTITINDVNEAPTDIALSATAVNENVSANTTVGTLSSTDPDVGNTFTYTLVAGTGSTDNASFNISGSSLRITASPDFETKSSYSVRVRTTDQGSLTFEKQFTITINDVNEAPTDVALSATAVNENVSANTTVGTLSSTDADAGNTFTYTLVAGTGSTDNASFNISGSSLRITASPDFETKSSYSVRVRTTDQGSLTFEKQFTITINDVNEAPTDVALSATAVNENVSANTTVGTLSSTDADAGNTFTYTLVAGTGSTDNASFNISGSSLRITASPDFETKSSYSVRVRTTDQGSLTFEKQFTITINDVNEAPTDVALSATAVNENVSANTTVGTLSSTDADAGNTFTYTLVAGTGSTDNASFNISGSSLRITASPDFETKSSYSVRVRTTDQGSLTFEKQFTITINDVNEAPTDVALSATAVNENVSANTTVGTLSSTDADAGNTFTYTLVAGAGSTDNASFNISGSNLRITASPDFETKSSYSVRVRTTDQGSLTFEKQFTITINDVNEAPTDVALSATAVNENVSANTTVGTLSSTDADAGNTFTYTLVAGAGSTDNASFNISGSNLRITASPDFETKSSYSVRVRTTDQGSLTFEKQFTITINDVNEAPTDMALSATSIDENVSANSTVGTLSSTDADAGNTFTYTLVAGAGSTDNASFNISGNSLRITSSPDFETKSSYSVRVRTTDQGSLTFEKQFTITINDLVELVLATISTDAASSIAAASATLGGNVTADGGASVTERGLVYNTTGTPTTADTKLQIGTGTGTFSQPVTGLSASTTYYVKAYAINSVGTAYGNEISFTTLAGNSAPTDIALSTSTVSENVSANTTIGTLSSTDLDLSDTYTYTLVAGTGSTDNASFNISGNSLRITASPDFETKSSYSVRVRTTDQGSLTFEKQFTITITDVNEAPTDVALSATAVNENVSANTTVGTLSSTDVDAGNTFTYTLVAGAGSTDNASFNISGSNLRITASPDFETKSSYSVRVRTTDQGSLTFEKQFTITINDVNEAPTDVALSATAVNESVSANTTVGTLSSTDEDTGNTFTYTLVAGTGSTDNASFNISGSSLRITASPDFETKSSYSVRVRTTDQGSLTFEKQFTITINDVNEAPTDVALSATAVNENVSANTTVGTLSSTDEDTGNTFTYTLVAGAGSTDNASFNISGSSLRITASPDFETKSSYSVRVRTTDQGSLTFEKQFTITISNVNEAPTDMALSASSIDENVTANATVGTLSSTDEDTGNTFTYTLVAGAGSTDNASFNISGSSLRVTASPDFETKSSYSVRVRTTDQGSLTFEKQFTITINDVNEAPTDVALSATAVDENVSANTTVSTLSSIDADAGNTFTYTLVAGAGSTDNASFNISGSSLRITASPDFETKSSYSVRVRTTDQGSLTFEKQFTITINDVNEVPTDMALSSTTINENVSANATVGTLSSTDVDAGSTFTYSLVAGAGDTDNASFNISGNSLRITASPDFETKSSYTVRVRTTDQGSLTYEEAFTITINDINEAPTDMALSATSIDENVSANATIGTLSSTDEDAANTFTYTLVAGAGSTDNAAFTITGNNLSINASPDFETKSSYTVRIRTTDQGSLTYEESFTITINDLNEAPTDMALSATAIDENVAANATVGSLSSTDEDTGNTFTYTLVAGSGDTDNASFNISGNSLQIINSPDFETKSSYTVRVRTTDQGSLTYEEAFTITINDINEAPTDVALSATAIDENVSANTTVGTLSSTDVDAGNTFTYTLVTGTGDTDNAAFNISGSNLRISASPDFETKSSYSVRIRTTDQGSLTYEESFTITINDLNEAPTDMALSATSIDENVAASSTVGTLSSTDEDTGNTFTYTLVAGAGDTDNASFNISGNSLQIVNSPDFETKSSYTVRVRTTDQGSLTYEEAFTITINDINEAPTDMTLSATAIDENVSANAAVGTLSSTDVDAGNTFTYTLVTGTGDTDNAAFNISGNSLRISASPDFETKSSYSVRIRTTDQGSLTYEESFTITINDLNEAPTDMVLSATSIDENVSANATVGSLSSTDEDTGNTFTYTLVAGAGDTDNASFNISGNSLQIVNSPDFETKNSYTVRIRTTDQGSLAYEESFTISINDLTELPVLTTDAASSVGDVFATLGGNITWDGGGSVTERGVVYNTTGTPTTADGKTQMGSGVGLFSQVVTGLTAKTTYYVRAYAINSVGTSYGGVNTFTTLNTIPTIGGAVSNQPVDDNSSLNPFATVAIADTDGDNLTATITLDDVAKGRLYANDKITQLSNPYNISSASSASIQSLVRGLYFIPANNRTTTSETTTFTIAVTDGIDNATNNATTVVSNAVAPTVTKVDATTADGIYKAGSVITVTVHFSEPVTVTGTPQIQLETGVADQTVNYSRIATHLEFDYTIQAGDESSDLDYTSINALTLNGGAIKDSGGKDAILTLTTPGAANSLGSNRSLIVDTKAPAGYTVKIDQSPINKANANAVTFTITGAEVGAKFTYTYSSNGGGTSITVSNLTITSTTQTVAIPNAETVPDGVVTVSVTLTDVVGNTGLAATDTEVKDTQAPSNPNGLNAKFVDVAVNSLNEKNIKCQINNGEIGTTYHYSIVNLNAQGEVSGTGSVTDIAQVFFVDLSSLANGELKLEVTLIDQVGNESDPVFDTIIKSSGVAHHEIPQGFTPNGDGVDDVWVIPGIEQYPNNEVKIYNRYGTVVWKTKGYDNAANSWDSYSNASNVVGSSGLPEGTYFYVIDLGDNKTAIKSGYVIVKR